MPGMTTKEDYDLMRTALELTLRTLQEIARQTDPDIPRQATRKAAAAHGLASNAARSIVNLLEGV